jgi:iron complex transport system substrate-binding protein
MKRTRIRSVAVSVAVAVAMAGVLTTSGCTSAPPAPAESAAPTAAAPAAVAFPVTVTDDAGRKVTIERRPERVVSLAPANTEIVYALGLGERVVGVTTFDDYPPQVKDVPKVGDFTNPNLEAIAGAKPDIVLVTGGVQADVLSKLEKLGAKVLVVDPQSLDGVSRAIVTLGVALGAQKAAGATADKMAADLAAIRAAVGKEPARSAFIEIGWKPLFTAGAGTLMDDMLLAAGGTNVVKEKGYVGYSIEQLVKDQPYAYLGTKSSIEPVDGVPDRPGYEALTAIEQGRIYSLDDNVVSRPGPRVVEGVRQIAEALHPEAFGK